MYFKRLWKLFPITWCETMILMVVIITGTFPAYGEIRGDFNGDGFSDLAISSPFENIELTTDAGVVQVLYGSNTGLQANGVGGPDDQFWHQDSLDVLETAEEDDKFGWSLSAGDFNNDGYDDLAIGVPYEDLTPNDAGAVHVLYGSNTGLQANGVGGPDDQFWHQDSLDVLDSAEGDNRFGWSLSAGDFNNDGYDDLAIGVPYENFAEGAVHILYGSKTGLQANGVGGPDDQFWHQDVPGVQNTAEQNDGFGRFLSTGDFNNDGYDDLVIGVPDEDVGTLVNGGAVAVLYGSATGLQANGVGGPDDQFWQQNSPGVLDTAESYDFFGSSLSAGDFNNDGYDDVVIGVFREDVGSLVNGGAVQVLYGSAAGLQATGVGGPDDQLWYQGNSGVQDTAEQDDQFGIPLSVGDFNNDGCADLAIGVPLEDIGILADAGAVQVLYGSTAGLQANGVGGPDDQFWHQDSPGVLNFSEADDCFGSSLSVGYFNNDAYADLAIGVPLEDSIPSDNNVGAVHVLYGSARGLQANGVGGPDDQYWHQNSSNVLDNAEQEDGFGMALKETHPDGFTLLDKINLTLEEP